MTTTITSGAALVSTGAQGRPLGETADVARRSNRCIPDEAWRSPQPTPERRGPAARGLVRCRLRVARRSHHLAARPPLRMLAVPDPATPLVIVDRDPDGLVATVTLHRPASHNALNQALASDLRRELDLLAQDALLRAVVVTGAGERAFCVGADLKERLALSPRERTGHTAAIAAAVEALAALPVPTIAAIRGYALAGGAELALACDLRVAAEDASFGFPEVRIGIFPGAGGVFRLPRLVGAGIARDLLFTGRRCDAVEAQRLGLVDRLVAPGEVVSTAAALARDIAGNAPLALRAVKRALLESAALPDPKARAAVDRHRAALDGTADYAEGLAAFAERRRPSFTGS